MNNTRVILIEYVPHGQTSVRTVYHEIPDVSLIEHRNNLESYCKGVCQVAGGRYVRHTLKRDSQRVAA